MTEFDFFDESLWRPDALPQDPEGLKKTVALERAQFADWSTRPHVFVVTFDGALSSSGVKTHAREALLNASPGSAFVRSLLEQSWTEWTWVDAGGLQAVMEFSALSKGDVLIFVNKVQVLHPQALGVHVRSHVSNSDHVCLSFASERESTVTTRTFSRAPLSRFDLLRVGYAGFPVSVECSPTALKSPWEILRQWALACPVFDTTAAIQMCLAAGFSANQGGLREIPLVLSASFPGSFVDSLHHNACSSLVSRFLSSVWYPEAHWRLLNPPEARRVHAFSNIRVERPSALRGRRIVVVVPFKDQVELTLACLNSLESQSTEASVRVVLVNNRSTNAATEQKLRAWLSCPRRHDFVWREDDGAFNFARINNQAVEAHGSDAHWLLLLNNDVELRDPETLETLAQHLDVDARCAFAGIRLEYPGGGVQHGGIALNPGTHGSRHINIGHATEALRFVYDDHAVMGVTFACAMCRVSTWQALGGLDERFMTNGFGDVDMCLRALEAGLENHYFGTLVGVHHESPTRGRVAEDLDFALLHDLRGAQLARWKNRQTAVNWLANPQLVESLATSPKQTALVRAPTTSIKLMLKKMARRLLRLR